MASSDTSLKPLSSSSDLTKEYIEKAIGEYFGQDGINVVSFEMAAPPEREGFLSEIVFLKVKFILSNGEPEASLSLVAKFLPPEEDRAAVMQMLNLHGREVEAYRYLNSPFPKSVCVGLDKKLVVPPLVAAACSKDALTLIMEDVTIHGYKTKSTVEGSSLEQTIAVFRSIALVHAVGVIDMKKSGSIGSITAPNSKELLKKFLEPNLKMLVEMFQDTSDEEVFRKMGENSGVLLEIEEKVQFITTFTHSDLWENNVMFDADDRNCVIIDWQFGCLGNLTYDIVTMLFMSSDLKILEQRDLFAKVLQEYWSQFTATLSNHGVTPQATYQDLEKGVRDAFLYGFAFMVASVDFLLVSNKTYKDRIVRSTAFLRDSGAWDKFVAMIAK